MSKTSFKLNSDGVKQILKSQEMEELVKKHAEEIKRNCGELSDEYGTSTAVGRTRVNAKVFPESAHAYYSNMEHNTLLKAMQK